MSDDEYLQMKKAVNMAIDSFNIKHSNSAAVGAVLVMDIDKHRPQYNVKAYPVDCPDGVFNKERMSQSDQIVAILAASIGAEMVNNKIKLDENSGNLNIQYIKPATPQDVIRQCNINTTKQR